MGSRVWWVLAVIGVLFAVVAVAALLHPRPGEVDVAVRGTPGTAFQGAYTADGVTTEFSGVVPADIIFVARRADFHIKKASGEGRLEASLFLKDVLHSKVSEPGPNGRIRARVSKGFFETRAALYAE